MAAPPAEDRPLVGRRVELRVAQHRPDCGPILILEGARIQRLKGAVLVDNAWSAPAASGCGGILSFLVNPIINSQIGLPAAAGTNTAILKNTIMTTTAAAVSSSSFRTPRGSP